MKIFLIAQLILILMVSANADEFSLISDKRVKKIKLLESTKKDVDGIFGKHIPFLEPIKVKGGVITVLYSFGKCGKSDLSNWDVADNVVVGIDFSPSKQKRLDSLKLDITNFKVTFESDHNLPLFSYSNDDVGIKYVIDKGENPTGYLHSVEYYPSNKFSSLKCKK